MKLLMLKYIREVMFVLIILLEEGNIIYVNNNYLVMTYSNVYINVVCLHR